MLEREVITVLKKEEEEAAAQEQRVERNKAFCFYGFVILSRKETAELQHCFHSAGRLTFKVQEKVGIVLYFSC